jgi:hypothetical protein
MMRRVSAEWLKVGAGITNWRATTPGKSAPGRRVRRPHRPFVYPTSFKSAR